jgi:enoyl-CoA hydratase
VDGLDLTVRDRVAVVTLSRAGVRNALDRSLLRDLTTLFRHDLANDDAVDVALLTGADPAFCAGLDLKELSADPHALMSLAADRTTNPFLAVREFPKPVIGAVNGAAFTGGLELALSCDFLLASERARFADTHARVGWLSVQGLSAMLAATVGPQVARLLSFSAEPIDAATALRVGLVVDVVPHDELLDRALDLASVISRNDGETVRAIKGLYVRNLLAPDAAWMDAEIHQALHWRR